MPIKRVRAKTRAFIIPHQLRATAKRLIDLEQSHMAAIRGGGQFFYTDGRHQELLAILPVINRALSIRPWDDGLAIVCEALATADRSDD